MLRLLWAASVRTRYFLRRHMPTNILLDLIRTRRGLKWGIPATLLAVPYLLAASICANLIADAFRLGRTLAAFTQVIEALDDASVPLYVVGEGRVDLPTRPVLGIMRAIAEFDATLDYEAKQEEAEAGDFAD